jgi:spore coat-associated protein N
MPGIRRGSLAAVAVVAVAAVARLGTVAPFTSVTSSASSFAANTVSITLGATGGSTNRLDVGVTGMVPGDTLQRSFDLTSDSSQVTLTTTASPSTKLDTDATNGLQTVVQRCSVAWTDSGGTPYTYTRGWPACGTPTRVQLRERVGRVATQDDPADEVVRRTVLRSRR